MKKKRVYTLLYGVMSAMLSLQEKESREQSTADFVEGDSSPSAQNDVFSSCPPLGGRDKGEGEEEHEEEIPSSVGEPTASPRGEAEEGTQGEAGEEPQAEAEAEAEEEQDFSAQAAPLVEMTETPEEEVAEQPVEEETVIQNECEESHEKSTVDFVEGDSSPSAQNDGGSADFVEGDSSVASLPRNDEESADFVEGDSSVASLPQNDGESTARNDEAIEEEPEEEEIDLRAPTVDGLRFEWREGTKSYTVTGLAEDNKEAAQAVIPRELFGYPVTEIGENAFRGCRLLTEVVIPEGVTKIGDRAFYGCYALERIELPDSLTSVGDEVFYLCMAITSQTEFDNAYYIGNRKNPYVLLSVHKAGDISSCVVHKSTKFIDRGAFAECRTLTKIEIPFGVLGIGCKAFYNCSALESVSLGGGLVHIGESAFYGCLSLRGAHFSGTREAWERIEIEENNEPLFPPVIRP